MSRAEKGLRWGLAAGVALLVVVGWLTAARPAETVPNSVGIDPADALVAPAGSVPVDLLAKAPSGGLSTWVVEVMFDPSVVTTATAKCDPVDVPLGGVGATGCEVVDTNEDGIDDTVKAFGGVVFSDSVAWADVDCDGDVDIGDAQKTARFLIDLPVSQEQGCPAINGTVVEAAPRQWGDVDCDGDVDIGDAQKTARFLINLPVSQEQGCPAIGSTVLVGWGLQQPVVLAGIIFDGVGAVDECSTLSVQVLAFTDIEGEATSPVVTNGEICIGP
ncbi:MAG: hypothetical protein ACE5LU_25255 [Anaerolineae bacterium]